MKKLILLLSVAAINLGKAQFTNVLISNTGNPEEVHIAINPKNTNQIVAGANITAMYRSLDAGATWTIGNLTCAAYNVWGDPVLIWDTAQAAYYIHLSNPPSGGGNSWIDRIVVQKSGNAGATYTTCVGVGKNGTKAQDKAWAVVNPTNNAIHMTWTQFDNYGSAATTDSSIILYSRSLDGGLTFSTPKRISKFAGDCIDSDKTVEGAVPAVGPNGDIYVCWSSIQGLMFQKSTDGGNTWLPAEQLIQVTPGGWDNTVSGLQRCNGLPFTFCDLSNGPYKGTIYVNYSDETNGATDKDIWIIKSTNGGTTWSAPIRVNDDAPGKEQFMSAMTIDQTTGYVYVVFYDRRNFSSGNNTDVYLAVSKDGGNTFVNYKINTNTFLPTSGTFFGDYIGISAVNNVVRPIWMQLNGGSLSVYTCLVNPIVLGIEDAKKDNLNLITPKPNPFKTETSVEFSVEKKTKLDIQLVDNSGRVVSKVALKKDYAAGTHNITVNAQQLNLAAGMYYLVFYDNGKSKYTKLIVE